LGILRKREVAARLGCNPATGDQVKNPARTRLRFVPAKALKELVLGVGASSAKQKSAAKPAAVAARSSEKSKSDFFKQDSGPGALLPATPSHSDKSSNDQQNCYYV
jgi:hypothetical protein